VDEPFEICWSCGTSRDGVRDPGFNPEADGVMTAEAFEQARQARAGEALVTVGVFNSPPQAHIARNHLEAEGIDALVIGDDSVLAHWLVLDSHGGVRLQVFEKDAEQARRILADVAARASSRDDEDAEEHGDDI
jgi:hypothetical protein